MAAGGEADENGSCIGDTVEKHLLPWQNKVTVPSKGDTVRDCVQGRQQVEKQIKWARYR